MEPESRIFQTPAGRWSLFVSALLSQILVLATFAGLARGAFTVGVNHYVAQSLYLSSLKALQKGVNGALLYGLAVSICILLPVGIVGRISKSRAKTTASLFFGTFGWLVLMILVFTSLHLIIGKQQFPFFCRDAESLRAFIFRAVATRLEPARFLLIFLVFGGGLTIFSTGLYFFLWRKKSPSQWWAKLMRIPLERQLRTWGLIVVLAALFNIFPWVYGAKAAGERPNVLLVSIDTLRADAVDCTRTPNLCALGARGFVFENAYATSPWTLPSHGSMLASRLPGEFPLTTVKHRLREKWITLAELFQNNGYDTAAFVSHLFVSRSYGFDQGFARLAMYEDPRGQTVSHLVGQFAQTADDPWFCFVHIFDPHWPYAPVPENELTDFSENERAMLTERSDYYHFLKLAAGASQEAIARLRQAYYQEVSGVDRQIGAILSFLKEQGKLDNTLILVTSDHGEAFGEKQVFGHGYTLDQEVLRVPFILALPMGSANTGVYDEPVDLRDVAPTLAARAGLSAPESWSGRDLSPVLFKKPIRQIPLVAQSSLTVKPAASAIKNDLKYITAMEAKYKDLHYKREESLFDLKSDPDEKENVILNEPSKAASLKNAALSVPNGSDMGEKQSILTGIEEEKLRSLGYLE